MRPSEAETIESLMQELLAVLGGSHARLRHLGTVMPHIYFKAAIDVLQPAEMELQDIALRLSAELKRQQEPSH